MTELSRVRLRYFDGVIGRDFFDLVCGDVLGDGVAREVMVYEVDPTKVIKFETGQHSFQNVMEWDTWQWVKDHPCRRWFAPCHFLSPCGVVLVQSRTQPLPDDYKLPKKLPAMIGDLKLSNFGLLNGRLVAHDYGTTNLTLQRLKSVRHAATKLARCSWSGIAKPGAA